MILLSYYIFAFIRAIVQNRSLLLTCVCAVHTQLELVNQASALVVQSKWI